MGCEQSWGGSPRPPTSKSFLGQALPTRTGEFLSPGCDCPKAQQSPPALSSPAPMAAEPFPANLLSRWVGRSTGRYGHFQSLRDKCTTAEHDPVLSHESTTQGKPLRSSIWGRHRGSAFAPVFPAPCGLPDLWSVGTGVSLFLENSTNQPLPEQLSRLPQLTASGAQQSSTDTPPPRRQPLPPAAPGIFQQEKTGFPPAS